MPEVEIGLGAVFRHVDLAVLIGAHRAGIHVDIGIKFLRRDLQPASLQKSSERSRRNALAEPGHDPSRYENKFFHSLFLCFCIE